MKKTWKKVVGLGLALTITTAALAGCGTQESGSNGSGDTFLIGGIGPLTGEAASYGTSVKQGAEIAIEEINEKGGVTVGDKTYQLKLDFMDDEAEVEGAVNSFNALMDSGANAIMGTVTSGAGLGIIDLTYEEGILMLTPSGSDAGLTKYDNAFRLCFTDPVQGSTMADYAFELGYSKLAIIYNNADEYSTGLMTAFSDQFKANGGEIVSNESFGKGTVDFSTQLTSIKSTDAEAIFVPAYYNDAAYIATQAAELGMELPFLGGDGWDGVIANTVDPSVLEGAIFMSPFVATEDNPFVQDYKEKYGSTPDQFAADGYDSVYVIAAAMEKAESIESEELIAAMPEIQIEGLTGALSFNVNGEPNKGAKFVEIINGEYNAR